MDETPHFSSAAATAAVSSTKKNETLLLPPTDEEGQVLRSTNYRFSPHRKTSSLQPDVSPISLRTHLNPFIHNSIIRSNRNVFSRGSFVANSSDAFTLKKHDSLPSILVPKKKFLPNIHNNDSKCFSFTKNNCNPSGIPRSSDVSSTDSYGTDTNINLAATSRTFNSDLSVLFTHTMLCKPKIQESIGIIRSGNTNTINVNKDFVKNIKLDKTIKGDGEMTVYYSVLESNKKLAKKSNSKKSKNLLELCWADENSPPHLAYTPISLPYVLKENPNTEQNKIDTKIDVDANREVMSRRPSVKHVDESNRNAAALFQSIHLNYEVNGENNFFHIQFPAILPALDHLAMEKDFCQFDHGGRRRENCNKNYFEVETGSSNASLCSSSESPGDNDKNSRKEKDENTGGITKRLGEKNNYSNESNVCNNEEKRKSSKLHNRLKETSRDSSSSDCSYSTDEGIYIPTKLNELPPGKLGKLMIFKSGKVKLKIGQLLFDVNIGSECNFAQEIGCLTDDYSEFMFLGPCSKRMVVTPDLEHLMAFGSKYNV